MLTPDQLATFFPDLHDERIATAIALVHSRFSTNTFPSWPLAHPFRYIAHNGEINTIRGNRNWMRAREALLADRCVPAATCAGCCRSAPPGASDSASFDEVLELLHLAGRSLPHAVLMMIPEAWENNTEMDPARRGVLRVPRQPDGAVGRPGRRRVHRRHRDRRGARPQRAAPGPLVAHRRRPGGAGQRGRRARRRPGRGGGQGPAAAGPDVPGRHRRRPDRRGRRDQGPSWPRPSRTATGCTPA